MSSCAALTTDDRPCSCRLHTESYKPWSIFGPPCTLRKQQKTPVHASSRGTGSNSRLTRLTPPLNVSIPSQRSPVAVWLQHGFACMRATAAQVKAMGTPGASVSDTASIVMAAPRGAWLQLGSEGRDTTKYREWRWHMHCMRVAKSTPNGHACSPACGLS